MSKFKKFIFFIFLLSQISCNIWDNIYSHSLSPHIPLPEDFSLFVINEEKNDSVIGELYVSSSLNLIKFSFVLNIGESYDAFSQLMVDFNEGKIFFDTQEKCLYKYYSIAKDLSTKFILKAYDLLSYFTTDEQYYHYIVVNPLELTDVDNNYLKINKLIADVSQDIKSKTGSSIFDKDFYIDFIIDKITNEISSIKIKSNNSMSTFLVKYKAYDVEKEKFNIIHPLDQCKEFESQK